jgi:hypothetical protein
MALKCTVVASHTLKNLRRNIEMVIERFMDSNGRGLKCGSYINPWIIAVSLQAIAVIEMIVPPDLNQARVNKCLIALVNRKIVTKDNSTVSGKKISIRRRHVMLSAPHRGRCYTIGEVCRPESSFKASLMGVYYVCTIYAASNIEEPVAGIVRPALLSTCVHCIT